MKDPTREASRWLLQAEDDLRFVEWIAHEGGFYDKACFIAQQAGEKVLKACLYATGKRIVLGHSLYEMINELGQKEKMFQKLAEEAKRLDRFYIPARYPNGLPGGSPFQTFTSNDLADALNDANKVCKVARKFLTSVGITKD
jgi:HEPN domain-containing protein